MHISKSAKDILSQTAERVHPHYRSIRGGRFHETFAGGGGALYAVVTYVDPDRKLIMQGPMGMRGAVLGVISFTLAATGSGTQLRLSHRVAGEVTKEEGEQYSDG